MCPLPQNRVVGGFRFKSQLKIVAVAADSALYYEERASSIVSFTSALSDSENAVFPQAGSKADCPATFWHTRAQRSYKTAALLMPGAG